MPTEEEVESAHEVLSDEYDEFVRGIAMRIRSRQLQGSLETEDEVGEAITAGVDEDGRAWLSDTQRVMQALLCSFFNERAGEVLLYVISQDGAQVFQESGDAAKVGNHFLKETACLLMELDVAHFVQPGTEWSLVIKAED